MLRSWCLLLLWLTSLLANAETLRVVIDRHDYYPHYRVDAEQSATGLGPELLRRFAEQEGYQLSFLPLPIKRVYHQLRADPSIDLAYPDNPEWSQPLKQGMPLYYSRHSLPVLDGTLVSNARLGQGEAAIRLLGLVRGFTPEAWQAQLTRGQLQLVEASDLEALIQMLQRGRVDAIYANPEVVRQRLEQMGLAADSLRLDPALPKLVTRFHLSSSQRRDLLERFDRFIDAQPQLLPTLQRRYGIVE